jgi:hypothetical protein
MKERLSGKKNKRSLLENLENKGGAEKLGET